VRDIERGGAKGSPLGSGRQSDAEGQNDPISTDGVIALVAENPQGLPSCAGSFVFRGCRVGEESLALLASSAGSPVGKLLNLQNLDLSRCDLTDEKVRLLAESFCAHDCTKLECVDLEENRITPQGVAAFIDILKPESLPQLKHLFLAGQEVFESESGEGRHEFASEMGV